MMLKGIISNATRVPKASASRHSPAKRNQLREGTFLVAEVAHLDGPGAQGCRGIEQQLLGEVRLDLLFTVVEPAGQELQLDVVDTIVLQDFVHLRQGVAPLRVLQVRVPEAHAREAGLGGLFDADAKVD
jgi:hypothetical protein